MLKTYSPLFCDNFRDVCMQQNIEKQKFSSYFSTTLYVMKAKEGELILNRRSPLTNNYFEVTLWRNVFLNFASCLWKSDFKDSFFIISGWFNFWNMFNNLPIRDIKFSLTLTSGIKNVLSRPKTYCMIINLQCYKKNWNRNINLFVFPVRYW